jgi:hypothetical protein
MTLGRIFSMYLEMAAEEDNLKKMSEGKKEDADGIVILVRPYPLSPRYIHADSLITDRFILCDFIDDLDVDLGHSTESTGYLLLVKINQAIPESN